MEASQPTLSDPQAPPPSAEEEKKIAAAEHSPAEGRTPDKIFKLSEFVHVGQGAAECEERETGTCTNPHHFHAWCRIPNQLQHDTIREKAMAAKARRMRVLKDKESDAYEVLELGLEELRATGDTEAMIELIVSRDVVKDHKNAIKAVREEERFEHIEEDQERLRALEAMEEDQRPDDEYNHLKTHCKEFEEEVARVRRQSQEPVRESLRQRPVDELIDMIREHRIERDAAGIFMDTFSQWEWYLGTMKPKPITPSDPNWPTQRYWGSIDAMRESADEVLNALDNAFGAMEAELAVQGKGF